MDDMKNEGVMRNSPSGALAAEPADVSVADFATVRKWFLTSQQRCKQMNKHESALLWADGLAHLETMCEQRDELLAVLNEFATCDAIVNYDSGLCWGCGEPKTKPCPPDCFLDRARAAIRKATGATSENAAA